MFRHAALIQVALHAIVCPPQAQRRWSTWSQNVVLANLLHAALGDDTSDRNGGGT